MLRRLVAAAAVLAAIAASPLSSRAGTGFETGSCALNGAIAPGSRNVLTVNKPSGGASNYATISEAVAAASEGDHIVIYPGTYTPPIVNGKPASIEVTTPGLRITGTDRNGVVLDGLNAKVNGFHVTADRVLIENMTAHNFNGSAAFYWQGVTGYWGRYLTAYDQGDYGVYAFRSRCGVFDNSFGSGNADSAFYIGGCYPCNATIAYVEATENGLGYSGTNAGGDLTIRDSYWHGNALGIVPSSLDSEPGPPERGLVIMNNKIVDNNGKFVPGVNLTAEYWGVGIALPGTSNNEVIGNTVTGNDLAGIVLAPLNDKYVYTANSNIIYGNYAHGNGGGDPENPLTNGLGADLAQGVTAGPNNCWDSNDYGTATPPLLEVVWGCTNLNPESLPFYVGTTPPGGDPRVEVGLLEGQIPDQNGVWLNGRQASDANTWAAPDCSGPAACGRNLPDGDGSYENDGAPSQWLDAPL